MKLDPALVSLTTEHKVIDPPILHYGFVIDRAELNELVIRRDLPLGDGEPIANDEEREVYSRLAAKKFLSRLCHHDLRITAPFSDTHNQYIIALDDTRRLRFTKSRSWKEDIRPVLKALRDELRLSSHTRAKWWWNARYGDSCVAYIIARWVAS